MAKQNEHKNIPELRFPEFKDEGEWESIKISELGETINGLAGKSGEDFGTGKPYVTYKQVFDNSIIEFDKCGKVKIGENEKQNALKEGDVLFTTSSETPNEVGFASVIVSSLKENVYLNSFCFALRPFDLNRIQPNFSRYLFHSQVYRNSVTAIAQGSTRYNLSKGAFLEIKVPIPKLKEQQKIAFCLSSLDDLITAHTQKLELLKAHKKGLMQYLFPQEGEKVPKLRFKEFEKDGEWEEKKLGDCLLLSPEYGINAPSVPFSKELPTYLRITDISEEGRFLSDNKVSVDRAVNKNNYLADGDIVLARTGASVGKSYKYRKEDGELVFAGFLIRVRPDSLKLDSEFLFQFLATNRYWKWVSFISARSGQPGINGVEYSSMPISLPPSINEQQKIASCLSSLDELISALTEKIEQLKLHKKGLMQGLFPKMDDKV